jgi:hypothetical protein
MLEDLRQKEQHFPCVDGSPNLAFLPFLKQLRLLSKKLIWTSTEIYTERVKLITIRLLEERKRRKSRECI